MSRGVMETVQSKIYSQINKKQNWEDLQFLLRPVLILWLNKLKTILILTNKEVIILK